MANTYIYPGAILELEYILKELNKQNIFLVTGKKSYELSGVKTKIEPLIKKYNTTHFNDFGVNPDVKDVLKGIDLFRNKKCDLIISAGGGSTTDMAKLINYYNNSINLEELTEKSLHNSAFSPVNHICIPTTAGSGSEATHFAVMFFGEAKYSITNQRLIPEYKIIDPEFHYSQTPYQKAVSGADALAQSIESYWSLQSTTESRIYSEIALKLIWENLQNAVIKGDRLAHLNVAVGAHLAGKAINISKTTAPHAFSYSLTKLTGLPHGHAVAIILPFFIYKHSNISAKDCFDERGLTYFQSIMKSITNIIRKEPEETNQTVNDFFNRIGIITNLNDLNISTELLKKIAGKVNKERLLNNPLKVDSLTIRQLINYLIGS